MKRLLTALLAVFILLGCSARESDADRFRKEYGIGTDRIRFIEKKDIRASLTQGTHVVMFSHPGQNDDCIRELLAAVSGHSGIMVYYYDSDGIDEALQNEIRQTAIPYVSRLMDTYPQIYLIKDGQTTDFYECSLYSSDEFSQLIAKSVEKLVTSHSPGCDGC